MKRKKTLRWKDIQPYVLIEVIALILFVVLVLILRPAIKKNVYETVDSRLNSWSRSNRFRLDWSDRTTIGSLLNSKRDLMDYLANSYRSDPYDESRDYLYDFSDCIHVGILWDCFDVENYKEKVQTDPDYMPQNGLYINEDSLFLTIKYKDTYYYEDEDTQLMISANSNYPKPSSHRIQEQRTWDLNKYFPKEQIQEIVDKCEAGPFVKRVWVRYGPYPSVIVSKVEFIMRTTDDPYTDMTYTLVRDDFKAGDPEYILAQPDEDVLIVDEDDPEFKYTAELDCVNFKLNWPIRDQDPRLAEQTLRFATNQDIASASEDYYVQFIHTDGTCSNYCSEYDYTVTFLASEDVYESVSIPVYNYISSLSRSDNGEIIETGEQMAMFTLVVDLKTITHRKTVRTLLIVILFTQAAACIIMFWRYAVTRGERDAKALKDTFINAMAHELKTPSAVIRSTAEYLSTGARPEKQQHYFDVLTRESESMDTLLNRMLTYSRMSDDHVSLNVTQTDWNDMINKTLASYSDLLLEKKMKVIFKERSSEKPIADPSLLEMVIDNLISNAVKYGEAESTIVIKTTYQKFTIWNKTDAFQGENLNEIWTPMYQTEQKKADSLTGGMGLAICASVLKRHNASYGAYREADGISFFFDMDRPLKSSIPYRFFTGITTTLFMMFLWFFIAAVKIPDYLKYDALERKYNGYPKTLFTIILFLGISIGFGLIYLGLHHLRTMPGKTKKTPTD